jgi:hypothetical protein
MFLSTSASPDGSRHLHQVELGSSTSSDMRDDKRRSLIKGLRHLCGKAAFGTSCYAPLSVGADHAIGDNN